MAKIKISIDIEETDVEGSYGGKSGIAVKAPWPPQNTDEALVFLGHLDCALRALQRHFYFKLTHRGLVPEEGNPDYLVRSIVAGDICTGSDMPIQTKKEEE